MNTIIDIVLVVFIILGGIAGFKRGLIKSLVNLIGLVAIVILSFTLRAPLANFLIDKLPFFNYAGAIVGLTAINILVYNIIAFILIFVVLYSVLSIIFAVTGFIDTLLKFTVIWVIPSKIGGAIVGALEAWVFVFLVALCLGQFAITAKYVNGSKVSSFILDHTPIVSKIFGGLKNASAEIYEIIAEINADEVKTPAQVEEINKNILSIEVSYNIISDTKAQELIDTGKIEFNESDIKIVRPK